MRALVMSWMKSSSSGECCETSNQLHSFLATPPECEIVVVSRFFGLFTRICVVVNGRNLNHPPIYVGVFSVRGDYHHVSNGL